MNSKTCRQYDSKIQRTFAAALAASLLVGTVPVTHAEPREHDGPSRLQVNLEHRLKHIVVIYQENWSFDSLYGQFPGADGLQNGFDTLPQ